MYTSTWSRLQQMYVLYSVHRVLYSVHRVLYSVHRVLYSVHRELYSVHRVLYSVHRELYSVHRELYSVHRVLYSIHRVQPVSFKKAFSPACVSNKTQLLYDMKITRQPPYREQCEPGSYRWVTDAPLCLSRVKPSFYPVIPCMTWSCYLLGARFDLWRC